MKRRQFIKTSAIATGGTTAFVAGSQTANSSSKSTENSDKHYITPQMFGAVGDGATDDYPAFDRFISTCLSKNVSGYVPSGLYLIGTTIERTDLTNDLHLILDDNAELLANTGDSPLFLLKGNPRSSVRVTFEGGTIDTSRTTHVGGTSSGSGISLYRIWCSYFRNIILTTKATTYDGSAGDTGIGAINCHYISIDGCCFQGMPDAGIYWTGSGDRTTSDDDGGDCVVVNSFFTYCGSAIIHKRQIPRVTLSNNHIFRCKFGIVTAGAGNNPIPGRQLTITHNIIRKIELRAIEIRWGENYHISDNKIIDFGYDINNKKANSTIAGIYIRGSKWVRGSNNIIVLDEWDGTPNHAGIITNNYTIDSTTKRSRNIRLSHTVIRGTSNGNIDRGIFTVNGTVDCSFTETEFENVTTKQKIKGGKIITTYYASDGSLVYELNGTEYYRIRGNQRGTIGSNESPHISSATTGYIHLANGQHQISTNTVGVHINRIGSDGTIAQWYRDGSSVGDISVASGTISYNGGHLTRCAKSDGTVSQDTLFGTVLSNRDDLIDFGNNSSVKHLNYIGVSDVAGDRCWAGVFQGWKQDENSDILDFFDVARKGDFMVRVASNVTVNNGDLLDSAGDGTARIQPDQFRVGAETIGKVISSQTITPLDDGSRLIAIEIF